MKKENIINLIKYHVEKNENGFRQESIEIAKYFDSIGDDQLSEYILSLVAESNLYSPQSMSFNSDYLQQVNLDNLESLYLPSPISEDVKGVINAIKHNVGINKFLFEGDPGTGKTEAVKQISRLLQRELYMVDFDYLIDSRLGQTNKNITEVFKEINQFHDPSKVIILFDEIDVIAMDRINYNDVREMGRATSTMFRELDRITDLNKEIVIIATTNLIKNFDKALLRRFDAIINFDRYTNADLLEVGENYLTEYIKNFEVTKDIRLFKKILNIPKELPNPGDLKNLIKTSLAFSNSEINFDYLRKLYSRLIADIDTVSIETFSKQGFTVREIEKLTGQSKSNVSRKLLKE